MNWFKMFTEARNDAKLRSLTDAQHRTWFRLLCYAAEQGERGKIGPSPVSIVALEVADGNASLLEETCNALQALQCVTWSKCNANALQIEFCSFAKRQARKPSDDPERVLERVHRHRGKAKPAKQVASNGAHVTPGVTRYSAHETPCNVAVTPLEEKRVEEKRETPLPPEVTPLPDHGPSRGDVWAKAADEWVADDAIEPFDPGPPPKASRPAKPIDPEVERVSVLAEELGADVAWKIWVHRAAKLGSSPAWIEAAIRKAVKRNVLTIPYVETILAGFAAEGGPRTSQPGNSRPPEKPREIRQFPRATPEDNARAELEAEQLRAKFGRPRVVGV